MIKVYRKEFKHAIFIFDNYSSMLFIYLTEYYIKQHVHTIILTFDRQLDF